MQTLIVGLNNEKIAKQLKEETGDNWTAERVSRALISIGPGKLHEIAKEAILEFFFVRGSFNEVCYYV